MEDLTLLVGLLFVSVVIVGIAEHIRLPFPVLMLLATAGLSFLPFIPEIHIPPDLILPIFLPPLLFAAAQRSSWSVFRLRWRSLVLLAVALVILTIAVVAGVALAMVPVITGAAAIALGAVVGPPDPVAVESVAGDVGMSRRLITVLQTEGLFNDAVAIVVFQAAVAAALSDGEVGWDIVPEFFLGAAIAVVLGLAISWLVGRLNHLVPHLVARSAVTLVAPFAVYLLAEEVHASGVVAVVVCAVDLGRRARPQDSAERLIRQSFWDVIELLLTGVAFGLMGVEMRYIITDEDTDVTSMLPAVAAICAAVVLVRFVWMLGISMIGGAEARSRVPGSFKEVLVLTWCGMRGLATLALALSLPATTNSGAPLPGRSFIVVTACAVLLVTLVGPGLTLPALMRALKLPVDHDAEHKAEVALARRAQRAGLRALQAHPDLDKLPERHQKEIRARVNNLITLLASDNEGFDEEMQQHRQEMAAMARVHLASLEAARRELLQARRERNVDPELCDEVLRRLDLKTVLFDRNGER